MELRTDLRLAVAAHTGPVAAAARTVPVAAAVHTGLVTAAARTVQVVDQLAGHIGPAAVFVVHMGLVLVVQVVRVEKGRQEVRRTGVAVPGAEIDHRNIQRRNLEWEHLRTNVRLRTVVPELEEVARTMVERRTGIVGVLHTIVGVHHNHLLHLALVLP